MAVPHLVRALPACKENQQAANILANEIAKKADVHSLVGILDKFVSHETEAGEMLVAKLVDKGRLNQMMDAAKLMRSDSVASRILAVGLVENLAGKGDGGVEALHKGFRVLGGAPTARKILALEIIKIKGKLMAMTLLGKEVFEFTKNQAEIDGLAKKARKRYDWILKNELSEAG